MRTGFCGFQTPASRHRGQLAPPAFFHYPFELYSPRPFAHDDLVLVTNRRVGEAFNIYAPDGETVICSLRVKHVTGDHDTDPNATDICADLEVFEDKNTCTFGFPEDTHCITVHFEDKLELFDADKKNVICEMVVVDIKTHNDKGRKGVTLSSRVSIGFDFDDTKCILYQSNKK